MLQSGPNPGKRELSIAALPLPFLLFVQCDRPLAEPQRGTPTP